MEFIGHIYGLYEPKKRTPFYVGFTTTKPEQRLSRHIWDSKNYGNKSIHKERLIRKLLTRGLRPKIKVLETVFSNIDTLKIRERYWISLYRPRTNKTDGGDHNPLLGKNRKVIIAKIKRTYQKKKHELARSLGISIKELEALREKGYKAYQKTWQQNNSNLCCEYSKRHRDKLRASLGSKAYKKTVAEYRRNWYADLSPKQKEVQRQKERVYRKRKRMERKLDAQFN